jgi:hypothetical protein
VTPEGKVKRKVREWIDVNMPGNWRVSPRGGPFGKAGCPDELVCWHGIFIAIEVKSDEGVLSALQTMALKKIIDAGGVAAVVKGYDLKRLALIKEVVLRKVGLWPSA